MSDEEVDVEYLPDNLWLVGSPLTVADRIVDLQERTGGFGHQFQVLDPGGVRVTFLPWVETNPAGEISMRKRT